MPEYNVVILDPHTSEPQSNVDVEARKQSDGTIIDVQTTNIYGVATFTLTDDATFHARTWDTPPLYQVTVPGVGFGFCYDYMVDCNWTGTEGASVPTGGGGTFKLYSNLSQALIDDAIAAAGTAGMRTIWLCCSVTTGNLDIGGLGTSAGLLIISPDRDRAVITATTNQDIFVQDTNGGNQANGRLGFKNVGLSPDAANTKAVYLVNTATEVRNITFEDCDFVGGYILRQEGNVALSNIYLQVHGCTGSIAGFFLVAGGNATYGPDIIEAFDNRLALTRWWHFTGGVNADPNFARFIGGRYQVDNGLVLADGDEFHWSSLLLQYTPTGAAFSTGAASSNIKNLSFDDIVFVVSNAGAVFGDFGSAATNNNDGLFVKNIYGFPISGLTLTGGTTFLTVDTDYLNVHIGNFLGKTWTNQYAGPPGGGVLGDHGALLGLTDADHISIGDADGDTYHTVEESADEDIHRFYVTDTEYFRIGGDSQLDFFNGSILETTRIVVTSNGTTVTLALDQSGGGDLTLIFSDGFTTFDTTPAVTVSLTPGSDTSPQTNYVYILQSTKTLTVSTSGWPSEEHAPIAIVILQSAATTQTENALVVHLWHDHVQGSDEQGHYSHIGRWIRQHSATWESGVAQTLTITTNAGVPDEVDFATTAGEVYQMHLHTVPAFDTATGTNVHVVNDSVSPYTPVTDLADLLTDSAGGSMSGKYFNLVLWASVSEGTPETHLFVNLPSGSYNKEGDALDDVSGFTDFTIPDDFKGTAFLISRLTLRHQVASGGTWTSERETDLRGLIPNLVAGGGTSAITTEFADNAFRLFDESDVTKLLAFQLSGITTGNTRTLTAPDGDGTLLLATGLAGGQTLIGGTASGEDLTLQSTAHATRGSIFLGSSAEFELDETTGQLKLPTVGSGAGILIGGDVQMYRSAADVLATPDTVSLLGGVGMKLRLYDVGATQYGLGIQANLMEFISDAATDDFRWGYGASGSLTEVMYLDSGTGQLQLPTAGSGGGILIGDVQLYQDGSGELRTPDGFRADGHLSIGPDAQLDSDVLADIRDTSHTPTTFGMASRFHITTTGAGINQVTFGMSAEAFAGTGAGKSALGFSGSASIAGSTTTAAIVGSATEVATEAGSSGQITRVDGARFTVRRTSSTPKSDTTRGIHLDDFSPWGTTGDTVYGIQLDALDGDTNPTRYAIFYGDEGTGLWWVDESGRVYLRETAAAGPDVAAVGQWWVRTATPNEPYFTDDAGNDRALIWSGGAFHDGFSDFVANEHIDHSAVTLTAGVGLSGGGDITANRTFTVDLNELTTEVAIAAGDFLAMVDITDSGSGKITFADLEATISHDNIAGVSSDDHHAIAHGPAQHTEGTAWRALYLNGSGDETELPLGADGTVLASAGAAAAPVFEAIYTTHVISFPAHAEDLATGVLGVRPGFPVGESGEHGTFTAIRAKAVAGTAGTGTNTILIEADDNPAFTSAVTLFTLPLDTSTEVDDTVLDTAWAAGDIWVRARCTAVGGTAPQDVAAFFYFKEQAENF